MHRFSSTLLFSGAVGVCVFLFRVFVRTAGSAIPGPHQLKEIDVQPTNRERTKPPHPLHIIIVGNGVAGALMANLLASNPELRITVLESRSDPRVCDRDNGDDLKLYDAQSDTPIASPRSLPRSSSQELPVSPLLRSVRRISSSNKSSSRKGPVRAPGVTLSARGVRALVAGGLTLNEIDEISVRLAGRYVHLPAGHKTEFVGWGQEHINVANSMRAINRHQLNNLLIEKLGAFANVELLFGMKCIQADAANNCVHLQTDTSVIRMHGDMVIGADGATSSVREALIRDGASVGVNYSVEWMDHGWKALTISSPDDSEVIAKHKAVFGNGESGIHVWPRGSVLFHALPDTDGSYIVTLLMPMFTRPEHPWSFERLQDEQSASSFFAAVFPELLLLAPYLVKQFLQRPASRLGTRVVSPLHQRNTVLIGDAAHQLVPFFGQGINIALEDAQVLDECLRAHRFDTNAAASSFTRQRQQNSLAAKLMSMDRYRYLTTDMSSWWYRLRQSYQMTMHRLFPRWYYPPLHIMANFHDIDFAQIQYIAQHQPWYQLGVL